MVGIVLLLLSLETGGMTFTESEVILRTLKESPRLKAREYQVEETQALTEVARRWNNPQLRISGLRYDRLIDPAIDRRTYGDHPFERASIGIRWSPTELGQRDSQVAEAKVEEATARAEREQTRRDTIAIVRELFAEVVNLERQRSLAQSIVDQRAKWRDLVRNRVKNQAATRFDQSLIEVEHVSAMALLNEIQIRHRQAYDALLIHMGLSVENKVKFVSEANHHCTPRKDFETLLKKAEMGNPMSAVAEAEIRAADAKYHQQRLALIPWPDFLQLSYVMAGDNDPGYFRFQLGLPLPLLDWKSADRRASSARGKRWVEKSRAEHRMRSAQVRQVAFEQQAQAELAQRYQESAGVIEEGLSYVNLSIDSGEASGLKEVLQLQSRLLAAQRDALKAELDCQRGQIELDRLTGSDL